MALGLRYPIRWLVGALIGLQLLVISGDAADMEWLVHTPGRLLRALYAGPYGIDTLLSARTRTGEVPLTLPTGELIHAWQALPEPGQWAVATLLWTCFGLAVLWAAASRHGELRRS